MKFRNMQDVVVDTVGDGCGKACVNHILEQLKKSPVARIRVESGRNSLSGQSHFGSDVLDLAEEAHLFQYNFWGSGKKRAL